MSPFPDTYCSGLTYCPYVPLDYCVGPGLCAWGERIGRPDPVDFPPLTRELAQFDLFDVGIDVTVEVAA